MVLSLIIFIILISSRLILVLCFTKIFSLFALVKVGCVLYTRSSYMSSNKVINKKKRTCHRVDFAVPTDHRMEMKENKK